MNKDGVVCVYTHTHNGVFLSYKKNDEIISFATTWIAYGDYCTKWSKSDKDKHVITYMWKLRKKKWCNEVIYKTETDSKRMNLWLSKGEIEERDKIGVGD